MLDERQGLPSASETERLALCPPSFLRSKNLPETTSAIAETGTRIHEAVETGKRDGLTAFEERLADECDQLALIVADECGFDLTAIAGKALQKKENAGTYLEQRLWLTRHGECIMSGKPDLVTKHKSRALVIDYKTGYLETIEASQNLQLRTLAVLVAVNHTVDEVNVAIVQPNIKPGYSVARYDSNDLEIAERQLRKILEATKDENAPANPGEKQCRYCKAKTICKEAQAESFSVIEADTTTLDVVRLPELLEKCDLADRVVKAIRDAALDIVRDGGMVDGWELPSGGKSRAFTSVAEVYGAVADVVSREAFMGACDIKIGALETAWLEAFEDGTKKDNLVALKSRLEAVTVWKDKSVRKLRRAKL